MSWTMAAATPYRSRLDSSRAFQAFSTSIEKNDPLQDFWFLKRRFKYVKDKPGADHWQNPEITERIWCGDCEDAAVWLASRQACFGGACSDYPAVIVGTVSRGKGPLGWHVWCEWNDWVLDPTMRSAPVRLDRAYKTASPKFRYTHDGRGIVQEIFEKV